MKLVLAAVSAAVGVLLSGCGGTPTPSPTTPEPTTMLPTNEPPVTVAPTEAPTTPVQVAWDNHFDAFGKGCAAGANTSAVDRAAALDQIMLDYDDDSKIAVFNDECLGGDTRTGYKEYAGPAEIRSFFDALFQQVGSNANLDAVGPSGGNPVVFEGDNAAANVFLTWRTQNLLGVNVITYATDSFSFQEKGGKAMIWKQNIVSTEPGKQCEVGVANRSTCADAANPVCIGWENHFKYFGAGANAASDNLINATLMTAALDGIMADYTDASKIQVFDNKDQTYAIFDDLVKIRNMFEQLFTDILAAAGNDPTAIGLDTPVLEVEETFNGVFLVWKSVSHPKATDTFVFDDAGKIIRQNIVVLTKEGSQVKVQV